MPPTSLFLILFLCASCVANQQSRPCFQSVNSDYFLVVLVEARHLDYRDISSVIRTMAKHPSDGSKNGDVGHAWIYLQGILDGQPVFLEGGHSGELGIIQAKYFEGVIHYVEAGDPNPIRYLWSTQRDGFFQWGNGDHLPTYAAKVDLTPEQFIQILQFIENYPFSNYCLTGNQCSSFAAHIASIARLPLEDKITFGIRPFLELHGEALTLWNDPKYSQITISSPDILERSLIQAVVEGRAKDALDWYLNTHPIPIRKQFSKAFDNLHRFPQRFQRYQLLRKIK